MTQSALTGMTFGKRLGAGSPETQLSRLESWLTTKLSPSARPKVGEIGLCHYAMMPDGQEEHHIIDRVKVDKDSSAQQIAEQLFSNAKMNVEAHTRPQRYGLVAIEAADSSNVVGNLNFLLAPPPKSTWGEGETEPATQAGALSQVMRHYEGAMRMALLHQQHAAGVIEAQIMRMTKENDDLKRLQFEMIKAREELLDRAAERNMRIRQEQAEVQRNERWVHRAEQLFGGLVERYMQLPSGTVTDGPQTAMTAPGSGPTNSMAKWLSTLTEEQRSQITDSLDKILTPEQGFAFLEAIKGTTEGSGTP